MICAIFCGYLSTQYYYFDFEYTINLVDLFSLIATIYIGIYIAKKIQNSIESSRTEKDLIIDVIKSSMSKAKLVLEKVEDKSFNFDDIVLDLKLLSILLHDLEDYQQICFGSNNSKEIKRIYLQIKRLITSTAPVNNIIKLKSSDRTAAKTQLKSLISELFKLLVSVNRK